MLLAAGSCMNTGCNSLKQGGKPATGESVRSSNGSSSSSKKVSAKELSGEWAITEVMDKHVAADADDCPYMGFSTNKSNPAWIDFYAYNGCNFINGVISVKGSKITTHGDFAATMKFCGDIPYEAPISTALGQMKSLRIERVGNESFLYLLDGSGHMLMTLRKHNLNFIEGAWRVSAIGSTRVPEGVTIQMVVDMQTNTVHGNAGCNVFNGQLKVNREQENGLGFSDVVTTRMTCPDIAYESQFLQALDKVASAVGSDNRAQLRDAQGNVVVEMERLSKDDITRR